MWRWRGPHFGIIVHSALKMTMFAMSLCKLFLNTCRPAEANSCHRNQSLNASLTNSIPAHFVWSCAWIWNDEKTKTDLESSEWNYTSAWKKVRKWHMNHFNFHCRIFLRLLFHLICTLWVCAPCNQLQKSFTCRWEVNATHVLKTLNLSHFISCAHFWNKCWNPTTC